MRNKKLLPVLLSLSLWTTPDNVWAGKDDLKGDKEEIKITKPKSNCFKKLFDTIFHKKAPKQENEKIVDVELQEKIKNTKNVNEDQKIVINLLNNEAEKKEIIENVLNLMNQDEIKVEPLQEELNEKIDKDFSKTSAGEEDEDTLTGDLDSYIHENGRLSKINLKEKRD